MCRLLIIFLSTLALPVSAASLRLDELPSSFLAGMLDGDIQITVTNGSINSYFESDGFAAYLYFQNNRGFRFLLDYDIYNGSHFNNSDLSGSVFLTAPFGYDSAVGVPEIDIYFDQILPDIGSTLFSSQRPETTLTLDDSAFASGHGVYMNSGDSDYIESGNMMFSDNYPHFCVECSLYFELNLVYLDYSAGNIAFNADDPRANLIIGYDSYDTTPYRWDLGIVVRPVPLPGALLLFASALFSLRLTGLRSV